MLTLYYSQLACSLVSHIALQESGLPFDAIKVDLHAPGGRTQLLKFNPLGKVPTLVLDNGAVLTENIAILTYIADAAKGRNLLSQDPVLRGQTLAYLAWCASTVHIAFRQLARPENFTNDAGSKEGIAATGRELFWNCLQKINSRLEQEAWTMGSDFSIADGYSLRFYTWGKLAGLLVESQRH
jgi:glutathione S-transferase